MVIGYRAMYVLTYKAATSDSMNSNTHDAVPCMLLLLTILAKGLSISNHFRCLSKNL